MASGTSEETAPTGEGGTLASETVVEKDKEEAEADAEAEAEAEAEEVEEVKEKKKRGRKKARGKNEEGVKTLEKVRRRRRSWVEVTPVERPSRERKTVERYMSMSPGKPMSPKTIPIKQGSGMKLRDIPNVFFKLSKRKVDENLQHLHRILFGKKATAHYLKRNIFEFSGFVWSESEEKDKAKLREKLDKCVKDRLLDFCDILDISVSRTGTKKEDVIVLILDFLQCPRVTRDVVLKDKEQSGKKRRRKAKGGNISTSREKKRRKKSSGKTNDDSKEDRDTAEDDSADERDSASDEDISEHSDQDKNKADEEDPEVGTEPAKDSPAEKKIEKESRSLNSDKRKSLKKRKSESNEDTSKKKGGSRSTASEKSSAAKSVSAKDNKESVAPSGSKFKNATSKKQKNQDSSPGKKANEKQTTEIKAKPRASVGRKGKVIKKDVESPTRDEMHAVVSGILKEVDFDTATLADILRQLGIHFGADLMHRKAEVKSIIEEVINSMTDESDEERGGDVDASRKGGDAETSAENDDSKGEPVRRDDDVKESPEEGKDE